MTACTFARTHRSLRVLVGIGALASCGVAAATTYRCDVAGHVTYADVPCPPGARTTMAEAPATPSEADRASAERRRRAVEARLDTIERERQREDRQDLQAAALARRRDAERDRHAATCLRLSLRAKRAHDEHDTAGPRDEVARRSRMHRADDDRAALCGKR